MSTTRPLALGRKVEISFAGRQVAGVVVDTEWCASYNDPRRVYVIETDSARIRTTLDQIQTIA